jgi:hypothetical protein
LYFSYWWNCCYSVWCGLFIKCINWQSIFFVLKSWSCEFVSVFIFVFGLFLSMPIHRYPKFGVRMGRGGHVGPFRPQSPRRDDGN